MKIKKALYLVITALEVMCFISAYGVQYFTRKKMGMARYVVYKNKGWEDSYPMELLVNATAFLLVVLAVFVLFLFLKRRWETTKAVERMIVGMLVITTFYQGFICLYSAESLRAYYFIGGILALVSLLQIIKTFAGIVVCKHEV